MVTTSMFRPAAVALAIVLGAATVPARAAAPAPPPNGLTTPDYRIETDQTHFNLNSGDFSMPHHVRFLRPGTDAVGDRANGNSKRGLATLIGSVVVHDSGNAPEAGAAAYHGSGPATLTCDQLDVDSKAKLYTATGHVHFNQGSHSGTSNRAVLDRASGTLHLEGDVHLSDDGSTLSADAVDYNLNTKDAEVVGKPAVITQPSNQQAAPPPPAATPRAGPKPRVTAKPSAKP